MYCPRCGFPNNEQARFCAGCGAPLGPGEPAAPVNAQTPPPTSSYGMPTGANPHANQWYGAPYQANPQPGAPMEPRVLQEGTFGAAWRDLTTSAGWFKQTVLLALVNAVPILSLSVNGYAMDWGRDVAYERREALPLHIFGHRTMLLGLCLGVFSLLLSIFLGVCTLVVSSLVPVLGPAASIAFGVFVMMYTSVGLIRMGVFGKFGAAFDLIADWRAFAKNLGTLFCASWLPTIIIGSITAAVVGIIASVTLGSAGADLYNLMDDVYVFGNYYWIPNMGEVNEAVRAYIVLFVIIGLICWYLISYADTLIMLLTYRAMGHWALRTVPEWREEAFEEQKIYGVDFPAEPMLETLRRAL